jgi:CheY-like chemotaxis protein
MINNPEYKSILECLGRETRDTLQAVLGSLDLLGEGKLSPGQIEHVRQCRAGAHQVIRMVDEVLMLGAGSPFADAEFRPFSPLERVRTISEVLGPLAAQRGLTLELEAAPGMPWIEANADAFEHIVTRMIEHAIRSVEGGSICLSVECSDPQAEGSATVGVIVRAPRWTVSEDRLTLRLVQAFACRMGAAFKHSEGRLDISFRAKVAGAGTGPVSVPGIRILVAEDCDDSFELVSVYLREQPCSISRARDGEQAVAMVTSGRHDMIFMDINMPRLDGYAATKRIREWETAQCRKRMPIIVLSAKALESQMRDGAIVGCSGYIEKPFPKSLLINTLNRYAPDISFS